MNFSTLDLIIVAVYLVGVTVFGIYKAGKQKSTKDYFLGGKDMKWWAVGFSIVASETSTLTFISIPGLAYKTNMFFLQVAFGYFVGRLLVSIFFIPAYYKGDLETAYDFIGKRFGINLRKITSTTFIITRVLASGVRLFATAIPVHLITGLNYAESILIIGIFTLVYTYLGGLKAVVSMDVVQLFIYLSGAVVTVFLILGYLPGGFDDVVRFATKDGNKFAIFNLSTGTGFWDFLSSPYTLLGGFLGGTFLTMASHGTDQLLVQRLLGLKTKWESQKALMLDAFLIVIQFAFFLFLGLCLYAFYNAVPFTQLAIKATGAMLTSSDEIYPKFIVENLPIGIAGLVIAGVLASAMGTLSSAISSLASSTYLDLFKMTKKGKSLDSNKEIFWSKIFTLFWGIVLIGGAMLFRDSKNPVVEIGLTIASFTYGGLLGVFLLGLFFKNTKQINAIIGFSCGILGMVFIIYYTKIAWTWYTIIGVGFTFIAANISAMFNKNKKVNND
jgi:solute:Na+ symporter, SSS family